MNPSPLIDSDSISHQNLEISPEIIHKKKMTVIYSSGVLTLLLLLASVLYFENPTAFAQIFSKSGFTASFSLIFVSEMGDKTFFIAALLAMKHSKAMVFLGTISALGLMTIISVIIGKLFNQLPASLTSGLPVGRILAVTLLVWFGIQSIMESIPPNFSFQDLTCRREREEGRRGGGEGGGEEENEELQDALQAIENNESEFVNTPFKVFMEAFSLVFIAEWGDRSMLATIALAVAQSAVGVATGAIAGHMVATVIAIIGGAFISNYISERLVKFIGGILFLLFAVATAFDVY